LYKLQISETWICPWLYHAEDHCDSYTDIQSSKFFRLRYFCLCFLFCYYTYMEKHY